MQTVPPLPDRPNLSAHLAAKIRDLILERHLPAGERVNEVRLAATLGVSRTPLREALMQLVSEGAVTIVPRIGFFVCALTPEEVRDIYPMRAILDPAALRAAGLPPAATVAKLKALNRRLAKAKGAAERVRIDDEWHLLLLEHCPNTILLALIQQFMWRTRRYELLLHATRGYVTDAVRAHGRVIAALEAGDLARACKALEANMGDSTGPVLEWLAKTQSMEEKPA